MAAWLMLRLLSPLHRVSPGPGQVLVTCNQRKFAHDSRAGLGWAGVGTVTDTLYLHL